MSGRAEQSRRKAFLDRQAAQYEAKLALLAEGVRLLDRLHSALVWQCECGMPVRAMLRGNCWHCNRQPMSMVTDGAEHPEMVWLEVEAYLSGDSGSGGAAMSDIFLCWRCHVHPAVEHQILCDACLSEASELLGQRVVDWGASADPHPIRRRRKAVGV